MITLSGACGEGTLWCTCYLPRRLASPKGLSLNGGLMFALPPSDWFLPPPNGVWYPVAYSAYGPRLTSLEIGSIKSVDDGLAEWNPCEHSTLRGSALYRGPLDSNAPFWRILASPVTSWTATLSGGQVPVLSDKFVVALTGRPCTMADPKVFSNLGTKVNLYCDTGNQYAWRYNTRLSPECAPEALRSTFTPLGQLYEFDSWYATNGAGTKVTNLINGVFLNKDTYERLNDVTWVRHEYAEYHTTASYTPQSSTAYSGIEYVASAAHWETTFVVTHVSSPSPGRFIVRYAQKTKLDYRGFTFPSYYSGTIGESVTDLTASILVMEPGKTVHATPDCSVASLYCDSAISRAKMLHNPKHAASARTAAVRDVQALDSNWIENLAGVKGTSSCITPLLTGLKAVESGNLKEARAALAGAYLVYSYVIKPSLSDYSNLREDAGRIFQLSTKDRFSRERRRGMSILDGVPVLDTKATLSHFCTYHLKLKDSFFSSLWSALERFGLDPSIGQAWDLIPFSFVVDWFLSVGDTLRNIDAYNSMSLHRDLLARIESFKVQWPLEEKTFQSLFGGNICSMGKPIEYSWYDRRVYHTIGSIDPIAISDCSGLTSSQMAQGTALVTQMMR